MNYFLLGLVAGYTAHKLLESQLAKEIKLEVRTSVVNIMSRRIAERMVAGTR